METHMRKGRAPSERGQVLIWAFFGIFLGICAVLLTQSLADLYQRRIAAQVAADSGGAATGVMMARGLNELAWIQWMQSLLLGILVLYALYRWVLTLAIVLATLLSFIPQLTPFTTQELARLLPLELQVVSRFAQVKKAMDGAFDALEGSKEGVLLAFEALALEEADRSSVEWDDVPMTASDLNGANYSLFLSDDKSAWPGLPVIPAEKTNVWCGPVELGALGAADEGWALRMITQLEIPTEALDVLRQEKGDFEEKNEGPGSPGLDQVLWLPYLTRSLSSRSVLASSLATAPQVVVFLMEFLEGRGPCENLLWHNSTLFAPPWQLEETWQQSLTYTYGVLMPRPRSPYGPQYESSAVNTLKGIPAFSRFEVYHPYYEENDTPDLVSPQWRVRRRPDPLDSFPSLLDLLGGEHEK